MKNTDGDERCEGTAIKILSHAGVEYGIARDASGATISDHNDIDHSNALNTYMFSTPAAYHNHN